MGKRTQNPELPGSKTANFGHLTQYPGIEILRQRFGELPLEKPFSAYKGDEPYIFVCYAHEDSAIVYPEMKWLHQQGVKIWYDEGISAGRIWRKEIAEAFRTRPRSCPTVPSAW